VSEHEEKADDLPESKEPFTFRSLDTSGAETEHMIPSWDTIDVFPSRKQYERAYCIGDTGTYHELWGYDIKEKWVFVRLLDHREEDWNGSWWKVVNGTVLEDAITTRHSDPHGHGLRVFKDLHLEIIGKYKKQVLWHELKGAERYFILSKHSLPKWTFEVERQRLQDAFAKIAAKAKALNATHRNDEYGGPYESHKDADAATKQAIAELQSVESLTRLGISPFELQQQESILKTLDAIISQESQ